ncbi:MAG: hypothetical protein H0U76_26035 [Ktedonobacteraceae bacterium]|nr:hypothetical protein [Ktedonobacteraceae bacterium]
MTTLIELGRSISQEETMGARQCRRARAIAPIETFCEETGGLLIGHRINEETRESLLIVQLLHTTSVSRQMAVFSYALQQEVIASFRYVLCDLVQIAFDPAVDARTQMHDFPLRPGELWFPALQYPHHAYVRISKPFMLAKQAAWLLGHSVGWAFV